MGLKDRLKGLRDSLSTGPIDTTLTQQGSPERLTAGGRAVINVKVEGENDGTVDRIELSLHRTPQYESIPLAEVPVVAGLHPIEIEIPAWMPPSVAGYADYTLRARARRSKGLEGESTFPVDVIGDPDHLFWPKEPRAGQRGEGARIEVLPDRDVVDNGTRLTGNVVLTADRDTGTHAVELTVSATITFAGEGGTRTLSETEVRLATKTGLAAGERLEFPFAVDIPQAAPPTLDNNGATIVWRAEAVHGRARGWHLVGVLDPKADAGIRSRKSTGLSGLMTGSPDVG